MSVSNGILLGTESEHISLPYTVEYDENGFHLRSHFPAFRKNLVDSIARGCDLEILFIAGEYYIDPEWILRERAHAPTEVKAVFSVRGPARFVTVTSDEAITHLDLVRANKQLSFHSRSGFTVPNLPADYLIEMLPQILHFEVDVYDIHVSQIMALTHLTQEHRQHILSKLDGEHTAHARAAAQIMRFAV